MSAPVSRDQVRWFCDIRSDDVAIVDARLPIDDLNERLRKAGLPKN